ncbi:TetR/AcrR family transcriptional regulator [Bradyrhizobium sp. LTSPM299]|uniref:TetR/AcrR family transcriptional regulator n=1 Tax=Bradyrhizobium sp. LTSPM299 TaxID=1619233 RepID=UPI000AF9031F|nr:TetR/AcrR family transcriptional regulator [Bradyrhizobium sp. LTSPM299]
MTTVGREQVGAKGERTRRQIIEGALQALGTGGVAATTTRDIAAGAGVRLATLHYHFDSKSALLLAVLEHLIDETTAALREETGDTADIAACIRESLHAGWRYLTLTLDLQIVQYELTLYALRRDDATGLATYQYDAYIKLYQDILQGVAARTGELDAAGCADVARFMLAGIDGLLLQELAKPNKARSSRGIEALIAATQGFASGLANDRKTPKAGTRATRG